MPREPPCTPSETNEYETSGETIRSDARLGSVDQVGPDRCRIQPVPPWARVELEGHDGDMDAEHMFHGQLAEVYEAFRSRMLALGDDIVENFAKSQVSYGAARKFAWLTPLTKTKALLLVDLCLGGARRAVVAQRHSLS